VGAGLCAPTGRESLVGSASAQLSGMEGHMVVRRAGVRTSRWSQLRPRAIACPCQEPERSVPHPPLGFMGAGADLTGVGATVGDLCRRTLMRSPKSGGGQETGANAPAGPAGRSTPRTPQLPWPAPRAPWLLRRQPLPLPPPPPLRARQSWPQPWQRAALRPSAV